MRGEETSFRLRDIQLRHGKAISEAAAELDRPPILMSIVGSHQFGYDLPDSDVDLRRIDVIGLRESMSLRFTGWSTGTIFRDGVDIASWDIWHFFSMIVKGDTNAHDMIRSDLVYAEDQYTGRIRRLAERCVTRKLGHRYQKFAEHELNRFRSDSEDIKPLLLAMRLAITGILIVRGHELAGADIDTIQRSQAMFGRMTALPLCELIEYRRRSNSVFAMSVAFEDKMLRAAENYLAVLEDETRASDLPDAVPDKVIDDIDDLIYEVRRGVGR